VIHSRESFDEVIAVVREFEGTKLRGIFHAFSGTIGQAEEVSALGYKLGIGGVLTYKNSGLAEVIKKNRVKKHCA